MKFLTQLLRAQIARTDRARLNDLQAELDDIDEKIAELNERRRVVQNAANVCKSRLGIDD